MGILFPAVFTVLSFMTPINDQANEDWSSPEAIDPLKEGILDFLKTDLNIYLSQAQKAYRNGMYREAAQNYLFVLRHDYADAECIYRLACCYARLGKADLAAEALIRAAEAGYTRFDLMKKEKDFRLVRGDRTFSRVTDNLTKWEARLGETVYIPGVRLFPCRIDFPKKRGPEEGRILVIGLHGNGGSADGFSPLRDLFADPDIIFAAPEGPYPYLLHHKSKKEMFSWEIQIQDKALWERADPLSVEYIMDVVDYLRELIHPQKIYLLGHSQGGAYAYAAGIRNSNRIDGIIVFGGTIPPMGTSYSLLSEEHLRKGNRSRVFIAHGRNDRSVGIEVGIRSKELLEKYGYDVAFTAYDGGHEVSPEAMRQAEEWIHRGR